MVEIQLPRDPTFLLEIWIEYGLGIFIVFLRFCIRVRTVGFRGFQGDDYLTIVVFALYTMDQILVDVIYRTGTILEIPPDVANQLSDSQITRFIHGSKCELAAWYSYTALIWVLKASMLFLYNRLCFGLWQKKWVKWLAVTCAITYITVFLTITFGCWPYASTVYYFYDIYDAHLAAVFQTTGGSILPHLDTAV